MTTHASRMLSAIEAILEGRMDDDAINSYTIAGRSISLMTPSELIKLRSIYKDEAAREARATKLAQGETLPRIRTRFI